MQNGFGKGGKSMARVPVMWRPFFENTEVTKIEKKLVPKLKMQIADCFRDLRIVLIQLHASSSDIESRLKAVGVAEDNAGIILNKYFPDEASRKQ